jgi:hypothetical protein
MSITSILEGPESFQCAEFLGRTEPLAVCESGAGFYLGVVSPTEGPLCRDSVEYFPSREEAQAALESDAWTQRYTP